MSKHAEVTHNDKRYIELGYNISYYRKHKGYTQEELAEKLDISRQHLGAVEVPNIVRSVSLDLQMRKLNRETVQLFRILHIEKNTHEENGL